MGKLKFITVKPNIEAIDKAIEEMCNSELFEKNQEMEISYYEVKRAEKVNSLFYDLVEGLPVKRFEVYPLRKELRTRLHGNVDALERLDYLVASVQNTL